jgi:glycosyltransferase involved in cell wall biosynthesis
MASELPIVLVADGEAARRVAEAGAGIVVPPGDARAFLAACKRVATAPALRALFGAAGRRAAETLYDRDRIAGQLDRFLRARLGVAASCRP